MALLLKAIVVAFTLTAYVTTLAALRLRAILSPHRPKSTRNGRLDSRKPLHLLIVLGSGGHTAEMMAMLERAVNEEDESRRLDWTDYRYRTWVVGTGDALSAQRAREFEERVHGRGGEKDGKIEDGGYNVVTVPRAREIHQSIFTAPISCIRCMLACIHALLAKGKQQDFPDLILCNGPATATILVLTSVLLRFFDMKGCNARGKMRTIYVESFARVKTLSLSGRLLERVVDRFLVQWPQLAEGSGGRREYLGVLVC